MEDRVGLKGDKMTIMTFTPQAIEGLFSSLPQGERTAIISYGIAIRLSDLRKGLFLAESKVKHCEGKYQTTLAELDAEGLPDDADFEMHEDYIILILQTFRITSMSGEGRTDNRLLRPVWRM